MPGCDAGFVRVQFGMCEALGRGRGSQGERGSVKGTLLCWSKNLGRCWGPGGGCAAW